MRARSDAENAHKKAKQQLAAFLLRYHIVFSGKSKWSKAYFNWLADISMPHPAQQVTLQEYIDTVKMCGERVDRLTEQIRQLSGQGRLKEFIQAVQSMRGVSLIVAATLAAEIGDFSRFEHPEHMMAYLGLIPSESSREEKQRKGSITKSGNGQARKVLVEAAEAYRLPARKSRAIQKRQEGIPRQICDISWKAQLRLCGRYQRMTGKGKNANVTKTAIARELAGFVWAIAMELPQAA